MTRSVGALATGIDSLVWNCVLGLCSLFIPLLRVNRLHQLPHSNPTINLSTHDRVRCCDLQWEQWCLTEPWTSGWNIVSLMQAVSLHCSWPAYYLGFEWMESLEFDGYFRPQKHATCEMCSGIFLRPALDLFFCTTEKCQGYIPTFFFIQLFTFFFNSMWIMWGEQYLCNIKIVSLVPQLILKICSWVCLSVFLYL